MIDVEVFDAFCNIFSALPSKYNPVLPPLYCLLNGERAVNDSEFLSLFLDVGEFFLEVIVIPSGNEDFLFVGGASGVLLLTFWFGFFCGRTCIDGLQS